MNSDNFINILSDRTYRILVASGFNDPYKILVEWVSFNEAIEYLENEKPMQKYFWCHVEKYADGKWNILFPHVFSK
jgi:hypothetical protein